MKYLSPLFVLVALVFTSCATVPPKPMAIPNLEQSSSVNIEDLRPATEAQPKTFSLLVTSEAYAIYRVSGTAIDPVPTRLLAHRVYETFPEFAASPSTLTVHHFVTYANLQSELRRGAWGAALGGVVGAAIMSQPSPPPGQIITTRIDSAVFQQTAVKEHRRAFYSNVENPKKFSANIIYIDTEFLGRRIATRSFVPPLPDSPGMTLEGIIDHCIGNHLALYKTPPASVTASTMPALEIP